MTMWQKLFSNPSDYLPREGRGKVCKACGTHTELFFDDDKEGQCPVCAYEYAVLAQLEGVPKAEAVKVLLRALASVRASWR